MAEKKSTKRNDLWHALLQEIIADEDNKGLHYIFWTTFKLITFWAKCLYKQA